MIDYTLLPDQSTFAVHDVSIVTDKEALAADSYYQQTVLGGKQKIKRGSLSVVRRPRCSVQLSSIITHYASSVGLLLGWYRVV